MKNLPMAYMMMAAGYGEDEIRKAEKMMETVSADNKFEPQEVNIGTFKFETMDSRDIRNITLGDCNRSCMRIGECAESCIADAIGNPESALVAISTEGKVCGHSWVRTGRSGRIYMDNIETCKEYEKSEELAEAVIDWSMMIGKRHGTDVVIGAAHFLPMTDRANQFMSQDDYMDEFEGDTYSDLSKEAVLIIRKAKT